MSQSPSKQRSYAMYFIGFILSLILTIGAFAVTILQHESGGIAYGEKTMVLILAALAITQMFVQLLFFFHLGEEKKPRLNTMSFLFMLMVVGIIAFGSIWIMYNLNYNMMPHEVENYIQQEEGIYRVNEHEQHQH